MPRMSENVRKCPVLSYENHQKCKTNPPRRAQQGARIAVAATVIGVGGAWASAQTPDIVRDEFNGGSLNGSIWNIGTWSLGRTQLGFTPQITSGMGRLRLDTYNPSNPGGSFKGTEIWTNAQYTRGTNGIEMEARVRVNALPSGLVTSFFTYGARTQFTPPLADEIDFEHVSKTMNAAPAGSKPILLTTWNDYKTDGSNFGDPNVHSSQSVVVPGWTQTVAPLSSLADLTPSFLKTMKP